MIEFINVLIVMAVLIVVIFAYVYNALKISEETDYGDLLLSPTHITRRGDEKE